MSPTDGTHYTSFDEHGRPAAGTTADGRPFAMDYLDDGRVVERFPDATTVVSDGSGRVVAEYLADGTSYTAFDGDGRPIAGMTTTGKTFSLSYDADGSVTERFDDGSWVRSDAGGHLLAQHTADGTDYTRFDVHGRPVAGMTAAGRHFSLSYGPKGVVTERFDDGSWVRSDAEGHPLAQHTADGADYLRFDAHGRPVAGTTAAGQPFTITYRRNGDVVERFADGSSIETDKSGKPVVQRTADGTVYNHFDSQGRPVAGTTARGQHLTIDYSSGGGSTVHSPAGSAVHHNAQGSPVRQNSTDGNSYTGTSDSPATPAVDLRDFNIAMDALANAAGVVRTQHDDVVRPNAETISGFLDMIAINWTSPAGATFAELVPTFKKRAEELNTMLDEMAKRLDKAYWNYRGAEETNLKSYQRT